MRGDAVQGHGRWHGDHASDAKRKRLAAAAAADDEHVDGEEAKEAKSKAKKK